MIIITCVAVFVKFVKYCFLNNYSFLFSASTDEILQESFCDTSLTGHYNNENMEITHIRSENGFCVGPCTCELKKEELDIKNEPVDDIDFSEKTSVLQDTAQGNCWIC